MLARLFIRNFLLVEEVELEFDRGFTAITGETGAGKSMILGALRVLFGDTLNEQMIRESAERLVIEAEFKLTLENELFALVGDEYIDDPVESLTIRRELSRGGRSRGFLQDRPATIELLRSVGEYLMDFHGQRDSLSLLKPLRQLEFLDAFAQAGAESERVAAAYRSRQVKLSRREELLRNVVERRKEQALLAYQLEEIERLGLREGEDADIVAKLRKLEQAEKIIVFANQIAGLLEQDDVCAVSLTGQARQLADDVKRFDENFSSIATELNDLTVRLREVSNEVSRYAEHCEVNPEELENLRRRAATLSELRRKHGLDLNQILEQARRMKDELGALADLEKQLVEADSALALAGQTLVAAAKDLSTRRRASAVSFATEVEQALQPLGFTKPRFEVNLDSTDSADASSISRHGADTIQFLFSASAGQPLRPLADVASGGESSRLTLAIKSVVAARMSYPLLVYDEIDLGISGRVAAAVASLLYDLGRAQQLIVVTHLPQIAARAEHHLQVSKSTSRNRTVTKAVMLKPEQRAEAVAALLAGSEISDSALAAADELLNSHNPTSE